MANIDISVPNHSSLSPRQWEKWSGNEATTTQVISILVTHEELEVAVMGLLLTPE